MVYRVTWGQGDIPNWVDQPEAADSLWTMLMGVPAEVLNSLVIRSKTASGKLIA